MTELEIKIGFIFITEITLPWIMPSITVFTNQPSSILQICPKSWEYNLWALLDMFPPNFGVGDGCIRPHTFKNTCGELGLNTSNSILAVVRMRGKRTSGKNLSAEMGQDKRVNECRLMNG